MIVDVTSAYSAGSLCLITCYRILKFVIYIYVAGVSTGLCVAQRANGLNTTAINRAKLGKSVYSGIFQASSRLFYNKKTKSQSLKNSTCVEHGLSSEVYNRSAFK
jgi:hypothetical protein